MVAYSRGALLREGQIEDLWYPDGNVTTYN